MEYWKSDLVLGKNLRVEIRKSFPGKNGKWMSSQALLVVYPDRISFSANGTLTITEYDLESMLDAIKQAKQRLDEVATLKQMRG